MKQRDNIIIITIFAAALIFGAWKFFSHHSTEKVENCVMNLRAIEGAKVQAAQELHLKKGDMVPMDKLMLYAAWPPRRKVDRKCVYTINPIGTPATCAAGHKIPN